jgi:hypothetical protein
MHNHVFPAKNLKIPISATYVFLSSQTANAHHFLPFLKRFIAQTVYTMRTKINYKIATVTNLNKYLHYGTVQVEPNR